MAMPEPLNRSEFARLHGVSASAVTQAIARGALELTADGSAITPESAEAWSARRATWAAGREHADRNAAADLKRTQAKLALEQQKAEQMWARLADRGAAAAELAALAVATSARASSDGLLDMALRQALNAVASDLGDLQTEVAAVTA